MGMTLNRLMRRLYSTDSPEAVTGLAQLAQSEFWSPGRTTMTMFSPICIKGQGWNRQTHKYAGSALHSRLKKRMTKHDSLSPRPNITGPRVPAEKLGVNQTVGIRCDTDRRTYERILKLADNQMKIILLYCVSTLSARGTGVIPVGKCQPYIIHASPMRCAYLSSLDPTAVVSSTTCMNGASPFEHTSSLQ